MEKFNVRLARPEDLDAIYKIEIESMENAWSYNLIEKDLIHNIHSKYFVVEGSDGVVGFCATMLVIDEVHITNIAVNLKYRGMGLGRRILEFAIDHYSGMNLKGITLEVNVKNVVAIELYKSMGFEIVGKRSGYYANNEDAYIMWKYIEGYIC